MLVGLAIIVAVEAVRLVPAAIDIRGGVADLQRAADTLGNDPAGWSDDRILGASRFASRAKTRLGRSDGLIRNDPLVRFSQDVRYLQDQTLGVLALSGASLASSQAFDDFIVVARAYREAASGTGPPGPRLLKVIETSASPLAEAHSRLAPALLELGATRTNHRVFPLLRDQSEKAISRLAPLDDLAASSARAARYMPAALGASTSRTYLVLLNNPSEQRPAGGFAGAVGTLTVSDGTPQRLSVKSQDFYNPLIKQRQPVPYPLARYLSFYKNSLEIGDAGWDPDFPTSARQAESLYTSATSQSLDGTIAIDPYAVSGFLRISGAVDVAGYGTFGAANFFPRLNAIVNASTAPNAGKQALGPISQAVLQKVVTSPVGKWPKLLKCFEENAAERHIQVLMHDPGLALAAAQANYDGGIVPEKSDYLMVSDANVGATKGDFYVRKKIQLAVEVSQDGSVRHDLRISYIMPTAIDAIDRALNPGDGSYSDYLRVYLPQTATLGVVSYRLDGHPAESSIDATGIDHGKSYVAVFVRVQRGHTGEVRITYEGSIDVATGYDLYLQKQAGTPGTPVDLAISRPGAVERRSFVLTHDRDEQVSW